MSLLKLVAKNKELLWQLLLQEVRTVHKGTYLGFLWLLFNPLFRMAIYTFVFGVVFSIRFKESPGEGGGRDFAFGLFLSLTVYQLIADSLTSSPNLIVRNPNFVKKIVFPLEVLPLAAVGASLVNFSVSILLFLGGMVLFGKGIGMSALWFPVIVAPLLLLAIGISWGLSAVGVFFRDIGQFTQVLALLLLYGSAVFYSADMVPPAAWQILQFNPLVHAIEQSRAALLWNLPLMPFQLAYLYGAAVATFFIGYWMFRRLKPAFADVM